MSPNRHYILRKHQSSTVTKPQQDDDHDVGRIQRAITTTHLDLEALEEIASPDYFGLDNNSAAVTSDSF